MSILCLAAAFLGYRLNQKSAQLFNWRFSYNRLLISSLLLSLIGAYFFYQMSQLAPEAGSQWTGIITIYHFFSSLLTIGFIIAVLLYVRHPSLITLAIIAFNSILYLERILIAGRRAAIIEFGMIILLAIWFKWRWVPQRWVIIGGLIVAALFVNSVSDYRSTSEQDGVAINRVLSIDYIGNLKGIINEGGHELRNAVFGIEAVHRTQDFDYGASLWNHLVNRYVPGQFVGHELKQSLKISLEDSSIKVFRYTPFLGTTSTGMKISFDSYWFFGAIIFAIIGLIMSRWYLAATEGNMVAQILVMLMMSPALHGFTHDYGNFFLPFLQWAVFLLPVLIYARVRQPRYKYEPSITKIDGVNESYFPIKSN
jgi:hypothetical protein